MLIDWFTVAAQLVNFLLLVWLLKRFLYKPVLEAINDREKRIVLQLQDAQALKAEAEKERDIFQSKNKEFDLQREGLLSITVNEVQTERRRLLEETRQEAGDLRLRLIETLQNEHQNLNQEIIRQTRDEVFAMTRKVLADLASADLETHMTTAFIHRLKNLTDEEVLALKTALSPLSNELIVRSTFELPDYLQSEIRQTIDETLIPGVQLKYETAPHLISGIELIANGYKIAWNIEEYLVSLENGLSKLLKEEGLGDGD